MIPCRHGSIEADSPSFFFQEPRRIAYCFLHFFALEVPRNGHVWLHRSLYNCCHLSILHADVQAMAAGHGNGWCQMATNVLEDHHFCFASNVGEEVIKQKFNSRCTARCLFGLQVRFETGQLRSTVTIGCLSAVISTGRLAVTAWQRIQVCWGGFRDPTCIWPFTLDLCVAPSKNEPSQRHWLFMVVLVCACACG